MKRKLQTRCNIYRTYGKRIFDICLTVPGLVLALPLLLLIAIVVLCDSRGPIFFAQVRIGKNEKAFKMWKVRSMVVDAEKLGLLITASDDKRITRIGRYLRRWKLDELPQLWNVLKGDMSLVGPRPEIPLYVRDYTEEQRGVFAIRPGITDPATIQYRNEEEILAAVSDRDRFYREVILPHKLILNLQYVQTISFWTDIALVVTTVKLIYRRSKPGPNMPGPPAAGTSASGHM